MTSEYSLTVDGRNLKIIHEDKDNDGFIDKGEKVTFESDGSRFELGTAGFDKLRQQMFLPDMAQFPIARWYRTHQDLLGTAVSRNDEKRYSAIHDFCRGKNLDILKVVALTTQILKASEQKTISNSIEKLKAFYLSAVMFSLKESNFYKAGKENKKFVDTILNRAGNGKLKIIRTADSPDEFVELAGQYFFETNSFTLADSFDPASVKSHNTVVHELWHFYEDAVGSPRSRMEAEKTASIKAGEFVVMELGLDSEAKVQALIDKENWVEESPRVPGLWVGYYQSQKKSDPKKSDPRVSKSIDQLETSIDEIFFVKLNIDHIFKQTVQEVQGQIATIQNNLGRNPSLTTLISRLLQKVNELEGQVSTDESSLRQYLVRDGREARDKSRLFREAAPFVRGVLILAIYKLFIKAYSTNIGNRGTIQVSFSTESPEVKEAIHRVTSLRTTSYIYRNYDGVK